MTTHSWDEDPAGEWVLEIENTSEANNYGTLTKFTLVLYGTAPEGLSTPPESSGCKTLTSSQACVVCEEGYSLHQKSCVQHCPPGFIPQVLDTHYSTENDVEIIRASVCTPCHASCATCQGPAPTDCLSCPSHASLDPVEQTCSRQSQSSRESRPQQQPPALRPEVEMEPRLQAGLASHLPEVLAGLSCLIIVLIFGIVFLFLHRCSGFSFRGVKVYTMDRGLISYKGLPPEAWQEECPSDSEEDEGRGERTAFIKDQSAL